MGIKTSNWQNGCVVLAVVNSFLLVGCLPQGVASNSPSGTSPAPSVSPPFVVPSTVVSSLPIVDSPSAIVSSGNPCPQGISRSDFVGQTVRVWRTLYDDSGQIVQGATVFAKIAAPEVRNCVSYGVFSNGSDAISTITSESLTQALDKGPVVVNFKFDGVPTLAQVRFLASKPGFQDVEFSETFWPVPPFDGFIQFGRAGGCDGFCPIPPLKRLH